MKNDIVLIVLGVVVKTLAQSGYLSGEEVHTLSRDLRRYKSQFRILKHETHQC